jgi:outer membrane protein OmpA-like peptidoglycan-associated protein
MKTKIISLFIIIFISSAFSSQIFSQTQKEQIFKSADDIKRKAEMNDAAILSPINFGKASKFYKEAEKIIGKGVTSGSLDANLNAAIDYYNKANNFAIAGRQKLHVGFDARKDAVSSGAAEHAGNIWNESEQKFSEAAEQLELGHIEDAVKLSESAAKLYRQAELISIKSFFLGEAYKLIEEAEESDAEEYAPKTLKKAKSLAAFAEKELSLNRYDTKRPRELALEALYEARHTIFFTNLIKKIKKDNISYEELLLEIEAPYTAIAASFEIKPEIDRGYEYVKTQLLNEIDSLKKMNNDLQKGNSELIRKMNLMESNNGIEKVSKDNVSAKWEVEEEIRNKYTELRNLFKQSEANIVKEGGVITLRLVGLLFDPGSSELKEFHFTLLKKVVDAVKMFPDAKIRIEGHTDSGDDSISNMKISEERAYSVFSYIKANATINLAKYSAAGYGQTKPIASNGTRAGRALNTRVDVVIMP